MEEHRGLGHGLRCRLEDQSLDRSALSASLVASQQAPRPADRVGLTAREREVLRGIFDGLANKEIASRLEVSESAVKAALQQLFHKTGVRTRSQLVRIVLERYSQEL
jgi:two-component system, NarL family, nitrate/nitrite response regulator NarL